MYIIDNYVDLYSIKCNYYISQIQYYLSMASALGNKINSIFSAQHSRSQIYGQEQIKRNQRIYVNE